jgi:hypothetical protein
MQRFQTARLRSSVLPDVFRFWRHVSAWLTNAGIF